MKEVFLALIIEVVPDPSKGEFAREKWVNEEEIFSTKEKAEEFCKKQLWLYKQGRKNIEQDVWDEEGYGGFFLCSDFYSVSASIIKRKIR